MKLTKKKPNRAFGFKPKNLLSFHLRASSHNMTRNTQRKKEHQTRYTSNSQALYINPKLQNKKINMNLEDVLKTVKNTIDFIRDASDMNIKIINKELPSHTENTKKIDLSFTNRNTFKACIRFTTTVHPDKNEPDTDHNESIAKCKAWFKSPLHSRFDKRWAVIQSSGDMIDYLILHLCPNLLFIRTLEYLNHCLDFSDLKKVLSSASAKEDEKSFTTKMDVQHIYDFNESPKLHFLIKTSQPTTTKLWLVPSSQDGFVFMSEKENTKKELDSVHKYYNKIEMGEDVDYLEHAFADWGEIKNRCLHPSTIKNMTYILT